MARCLLAELTFADYNRIFAADAPLSALDRQIGEMSARGYTAVEISMAVHCSTATVERRRKSILRRAGMI